MVAVQDTWRWDPDSFVKAWEAGVFGDQRVEMIEGSVVPVVIGEWHGVVNMRVARRLPDDGGAWTVLSASLPSAGSVPDPDVWVRRADAEPVGRLGQKLFRWAPVDVGLVVEVSDETVSIDRGIKADTYGSAGFPTYWVVQRHGIEVLTDPHPGGYRDRRLIMPDDRIEVPYLPGTFLAVDDLLTTE